MLDLSEAIADAIQRFDHVELAVNRLELLAQALDVTVDRAVVHIDLLVIGGIHQRIAAFDHARTLRQRMQDQEFRDGERHRLPLPGAGVALLIHHKLPALQRLRLLARRLGSDLAIARAAQNRPDTLDQKTLREGFAHKIVSTHLEAEEFVDLVVLGGQEDHRHIALLAQPAQQFHAIHARHLDVQDRQVRRPRAQPFERRNAVGVGLGPIAFRLQCDGNGGENVAVVIDKRDCCHIQRLPHGHIVPICIDRLRSCRTNWVQNVAYKAACVTRVLLMTPPDAAKLCKYWPNPTRFKRFKRF